MFNGSGIHIPNRDAPICMRDADIFTIGAQCYCIASVIILHFRNNFRCNTVPNTNNAPMLGGEVLTACTESKHRRISITFKSTNQLSSVYLPTSHIRVTICQSNNGFAIATESEARRPTPYFVVWGNSIRSLPTFEFLIESRLGNPGSRPPLIHRIPNSDDGVVESNN